MDDKMMQYRVSRMLFSDLYKIMMNKVTFVGLRGRSTQSTPLDPPLINLVFSSALRQALGLEAYLKLFHLSVIFSKTRQFGSILFSFQQE